MKIILTDETEYPMAAGPPAGPGDGVLWDRLRGGDREALGLLFDRYADDVHAFAFRRTASWAAAEDIVQTTFLTTWRRFQHNPPGPLTAPSARAWLLVVAANECRTLHRTARRFRSLLDRLPDPPPTPTTPPRSPTGWTTNAGCPPYAARWPSSPGTSRRRSNWSSGPA
ncbi:RNA polymerase sigma factor [Kribbella sp. CA-253562]|uniref:RNA polymerase sigma factor n=1 Tax=Kribbella sp. CA-253562 TaxID=3239942 RepID=UPI003D8D540D